MAVTPRLILLLVGLILFILAAAWPAPPTRIALVPAGLAFLTAALIAGP